MGLLDSTAALRASADPQRDAARELESMVLKQVLTSSGAFRGSAAAGASMWSDLLAESVAAAVTARGGFLTPSVDPSTALADRSSRAKSRDRLPDAAALARVRPSTPLGVTGGDTIDPLGANGTVTSPFGDRVDPLDGTHRFHSGIDLAAPEGTPILAVREGVVVSAGPRGGYGNTVELRHADGSTTLYAHAASLGVTAGQRVREGEPIGVVGSTGRSTGNHLHFELRREGHSLDPGTVRSALQVYRRRADGSSGQE